MINTTLIVSTILVSLLAFSNEEYRNKLIFNPYLVDKKKDERRLSLTEDWVQISQVAKNYYSNKKLASFVEKWKETVHIENKLAQFKLDASEEKSAPEKANLTAPN